MNINASLDEFKRFKKEFNELSEEPISESDTRSKILDKIFINVLGWEESHIRREGYLKETGYYDYIISSGIFAFVVEAKKTFVEFALPSNKIKFLKTKILLTNATNEKIINQVRSYLIEKGLLFGVISNGKQFIISQFINTNGSNWRENNAIIFNGFEDLENRFIEFYELLSYEYIVNSGKIVIKEKKEFEKRLIQKATLRRKREKLIRNDLSDKLMAIIDVIFREINYTQELDEKSLNDCYVFNDDVEKHHSEMNLMFLDSPPKFDERISKVRNTVNTQRAIEKTMLKENVNLPNPIVLIGGKGVGKTSFIKYFTKISLNERTKKKIPIVYIDFIKYNSIDLIKDTSYMFQQILNKLYEDHPSLNLENYKILKRIYKKEIKQKTEDGIWSIYNQKPERIEEKINEFITEKLKQPINHLVSISEYLINPSHKRLCIIFDNADQLDFKTQREAFLLSQSIHKRLKCIIMISLREGYYFQWKDKPPFDAFQPNIFHITAPSYREVLRKRVKYVLDNFDFKETKGNLNNIHFVFSDKSQVSFFRNLYRTIFGNQNSQILSFLEQTSYPNIRLGLDKFNSFLVSGHTKVESYMTTDYYKIPIWEFVKSVALESGYYYLSRKNKLFNLFLPSKNNQNHFTKLRILHYLKNEVELTSYTEHYVPTKKLLSDFSSCGYNIELVVEELNELLNYGLINSESYISDTKYLNIDIKEFQISITQSGVYYCSTVVSQFYYYDLVFQDTPIYDEDSYNSICKYFVTPEVDGFRPLDKRISCVEEFIKYLRKEEMQHNSYPSEIENKALTMSVLDEVMNNGLTRNLKRLKNSFIGEVKVRDSKIIKKHSN
ncbi:MAG: P-loop NTPase fold protein [Urechidicola sp.]|nr:P-loop NTPase fold protein [Urechidicola sp.]